jgi:hypothetical protein
MAGKPGIGLLIGIGDKPKPGEGPSPDGMESDDEGKRMAAEAVMSALESRDAMAFYDALKGCIDYVLEEDDGEAELGPMDDEMAMEPEMAEA